MNGRFFMIIKYKSRIALAAFLLLAQVTPTIHGMGPGMFNGITAAFAMMFALPMMIPGICAGTALCHDAATDAQVQNPWQEIQKKRREHIASAMRNLHHAEDKAQKEAVELYPGNAPIPTSMSKRCMKGFVGLAFVVGSPLIAYYIAEKALFGNTGRL